MGHLLWVGLDVWLPADEDGAPDFRCGPSVYRYDGVSCIGPVGHGWMAAYGIDPKIELFPNVHDRTTQRP